MLPNWMNKRDEYVAPSGGHAFALKTMRSLGDILSRIKIQNGHEKQHHLPALWKMVMLLVFIFIIAASQNRLILMAGFAGVLGYLCTWPAKDMAGILKAAFLGSLFAVVLFLPAAILHPAAIGNYIRIVLKVFLSLSMVNIFNHTSQWNHVTAALRKLHVPGIFIFTLDISIKYIVLLGNLIRDLLTSYLLRSVGKNNKKYASVGGVMGMCFVQGAEMNQHMYEAMICRGFTDDYKGL